jgi:hypothetical protein
MPFCTSCGKEVTPGKKFCEYCGTPLDQPAAQSAPATPPVVPPAAVNYQSVPVKPSGGSRKAMVIAGIVVILVVIAGVYFVGLPIISRSPANGPAAGQVTALPTPPLTPSPTTPAMPATGGAVALGIPAASETYEEEYMETYNQVYSINHAFIGGQKEVFTQDTSVPPLYIKYNITPKMFSGEKTVDIGLPSEHLVNLSYISPNAWFKVRVYDVGNGVIVEEQGFNKEHSIMTKQEFMVRAPGTYRVEMTGNDVIAEVRILTGKS